MQRNFSDVNKEFLVYNNTHSDGNKQIFDFFESDLSGYFVVFLDKISEMSQKYFLEIIVWKDNYINFIRVFFTGISDRN